MRFESRPTKPFKKFPVLLMPLLLSLFAFHSNSIAQVRGTKQEPPWRQYLYKSDVVYEDYACDEQHTDAVKEYFRSRPLNRMFRICHNDCPYATYLPLISFPRPAKAIQAKGRISVHVLADEQGTVLYARVLYGNVLLWSAARKGACQTRFNSYEYGKRQGVMHFWVENYNYLGVPKYANEL
ncbi:MAG: hypothetical protein R2684_16945 [Pyrinomonadaceae bacterium]